MALIIGLGLSCCFYLSLEKNRKQLDEIHFQQNISEIEYALQERMRIYTDALQSGVSLFGASKSVERDEWKFFVESLKIMERYPGLRGMGVVFPTTEEKLPQFLEKIRADGSPDFSIKKIPGTPPNPSIQEHLIITYIDPLDKNIQAQGLDIASEINRRTAAEFSRDTGETVMTSKITLVQETQKTNGFLLFLPVYKKNSTLNSVKERREALEAWVYAPFITQDFITHAIQKNTKELDFFIFEDDMNEINLIYPTAQQNIPHEFEKISAIHLAKKDFKIGWIKNSTFHFSSCMPSIWVLLLSSLLSFILAGLLWSLFNMEKRARALAEQKTLALRKSEGNLIKSYQALEIKAQEANMANQKLQSTQEQLLEVQKMEAIGKLAGGVAHDFNNILGGILGYASILRDKLAHDPKLSRHVGIIISSAERGAQLTKELLGFARKGKYEKKLFCLNDSIEESINLLSTLIGKNITIKKNLDPSLWATEGDSGQMLQILLNMGINSRDAMSDQGGEICIQTDNLLLEEQTIQTHPFFKSLKPGKYVHLIFSDTGSGIPKEIQNKIYDPFFTTKAPGKGTGLGLSMIYGIIQNHGGLIYLDNAQSAGAWFHIYLPAIEKQQEILPLPQEKKISFDMAGIHVLVADDEPTIREYFVELLKNAGASVYTATNGEEALKIIEEKKEVISIILLDVIMPIMDGIQAYKEIQKVVPKTPIIFISGYSENDTIATLRQENNVLGFIQKPFTKEEIVAEIQKKIK